MTWCALITRPQPPAWHGPAQVFRLLGNDTAKFTPRKYLRRAWRPWTLLTPDTKLLTPRECAACWPLLIGANN